MKLKLRQRMIQLKNRLPQIIWYAAWIIFLVGGFSSMGAASIMRKGIIESYNDVQGQVISYTTDYTFGIHILSVSLIIFAAGVGLFGLTFIARHFIKPI